MGGHRFWWVGGGAPMPPPHYGKPCGVQQLEGQRTEDRKSDI